MRLLRWSLGVRRGSHPGTFCPGPHPSTQGRGAGDDVDEGPVPPEFYPSRADRALGSGCRSSLTSILLLCFTFRKVTPAPEKQQVRALGERCAGLMAPFSSLGWGARRARAGGQAR